jgi:hypothetical protein
LTAPWPNAGDAVLNLPIVVWAPDFNEKSGGCIVLHLLAHMLRGLGHEVYVAQTPKRRPAKPKRKKPPARPARKPRDEIPPHLARGLTGRIIRRLLAASRVWRRRPVEAPAPAAPAPPRPKPLPVATHPAMPLPGMPDLGGRRFIAVYPEIVHGNPLGADYIARWLLYRPGFHAPKARFTQNEVVFFYQRAFLPEGQDVPEDHLLQLHWIRKDVYRDFGLNDRHGTCRMVRKGRDTFDPAMAAEDRFEILDKLSHEEIAQAFNQCEVFVCHDPYTFYLYYAALCGCVPMVVPQPGLDAKTWRDGYELPFGVAYGAEELDWAKATRAELLAEIDALQERELEMVKTFVRKLEAHVAAPVD